MYINKQLILEAGHIILEAVHSNHPKLDKSKLKDPNITYIEGKKIVDARKELHDDIKERRGLAQLYSAKIKNYSTQKDRVNDYKHTLNYNDNRAREISQTGKAFGMPKEQSSLGDNRFNKMIYANPRMVQSARQ